MQFNITLFHTALQLLRHLEHKIRVLNSQQAPTSPSQVTYWVSLTGIWEKIVYVIAVLHFYKILITPFRSPFLCGTQNTLETHIHDDIMTWKWFPCYCPNAVTIGFPPQMASKPGGFAVFFVASLNEVLARQWHIVHEESACGSCQVTLMWSNLPTLSPPADCTPATVPLSHLHLTVYSSYCPPSLTSS